MKTVENKSVSNPKITTDYLELLKPFGSIVVILVIITSFLFYFLGIKSKYNPHDLLLVLNCIFVVAPSLIVGTIAARSFTRTGVWPTLWMGIGTLTFGLAVLLSNWFGLSSSNNATTVYAIVALLAGSFHLISGFFALNAIPSKQASGRFSSLLQVYISALVFIIVFAVISLHGVMPPFFLASSGGTNIRTIIQTIAATFFLLAGLMLFQPSLKSKSSMLHWYSLGLLLMGLSMGGSIIVKSVGTPFSWTLRIAQLLGGVFILFAAVDTLNEARSRQISVGDVMADSFNEIQAKFKQSEERFRNLFENMTEGFAICEMIYDVEGKPVDYRFLSANSMLGKIQGLSPSKIIGKTIRAINPNVQMKAIENFGKVVSTGESLHFENYSQDLQKWFEVYSYRSGPGQFAFVLLDISERKKAEEALVESEARFRSVLDSTRDVIYRTNLRTGRYEYISPSSEEIIGYSGSELAALNRQTSLAMIHPDDLSLFQSLLKHSEETGYGEGEYRLQTKKGDYLWVSNRLSITKDSAGRPLYRDGIFRDITERKKAEEALKASEEKYHNLFETMSEGFILAENVNDDDGKPVDYRFLDVNSAGERFFGRPRSELIGRTYRTIGGEKADPEWIEKLTHVALTGEPVIIERYAPVGGQWVSLKAYSPRVGQFAAFFENITERKKAEDALKANEEQFQALANNIPQLAWMADGEGWIFWYNQRWYDYTGTNLEEMKGWGWQKVHHPDYVEPVTEKFKKYVATGEAWEDTFPLRGKDDNYRWFLSRAFAIRDNNGKVMRWFGTNTDITEKLEAEENLRRYSSDLEVSNKELEAFAYSVSHDLRAPLRTLDGFSKAVMEDYEDKLDDTGKDYLRRVRDAAKHMDQITRDMLTLSRVIRSDLRMDDVNLSNIVSTIANELREKTPSRKVEFIISPDVIARGDASLLQMALFNLMENAWKFTAKTTEARIEFGTMVKDDERIYFVSDNGVGFDMRYVDKLFQPFQRLHTDAEYPGTGIGLAIVPRVIRRHGGRILAESQEGKGTTIYFTLG